MPALKGRLLALPTNIGLGWKFTDSDERSSFFYGTKEDTIVKYRPWIHLVQAFSLSRLAKNSFSLHQTQLKFPEAVFLVVCGPSMNELRAT
jgi:hypothetical protein